MAPMVQKPASLQPCPDTRGAVIIIRATKTKYFNMVFDTVQEWRYNLSCENESRSRGLRYYIPSDWFSIEASSTTFSYSAGDRSLKK